MADPCEHHHSGMVYSTRPGCSTEMMMMVPGWCVVTGGKLCIP